MKAIKFLLLPILVFAIIVWVMDNIKTWTIGFEFGKEVLSDASFVKLILFILVPLLLIFFIKGLKSRSGIHFDFEKDSMLLAWKSFYLVGPAFMGFFIINLFGWTIKDWYGASVLTIIFSIAFYFVPKITKNLPTYTETEKNNLKILMALIVLSISTAGFSIYSELDKTIFFKFLCFISIVAVGEELLFRGYLQSSFNAFFGKPYQIANVSIGWGLILSSILFGLMHSLLSEPIAWPWMSFTFVGGLILGFIREKDGSLLAPILLHFLMDFPMIFLS